MPPITRRPKVHQRILAMRKRLAARLALRRAGPQSSRSAVAEGLRELRLRDALDRIALGLYPLCEACGDRIEADRLRSDPAARLCWSCDARRTRRSSRSRT
jgi:hypothetical protein